MVLAKTVESSNTLLSSPTTFAQGGLTFVFAGATAGIGLSTLYRFAERAHNPGAPPTAYIIGRSRAKFQPHLEKLSEINPVGRFIFLEAQYTLLKDVKRVADEIVRLVGNGKIDAVIQSPGFLTFKGRIETEEGIDDNSALIYYSRILLVYTLLPLLQRAPAPRVVSVFSAGNEGTFTREELASEFRLNYSRLKATFAFSALTTLSYEVLAKEYPTVAFIHSYPGGVKTDILHKLADSTTGWLSYPLSFVKSYMMPVIWWLFVTVGYEESGERHLFEATSEMYPAAAAKDKPTGRGVVPLIEGLQTAKSSSGAEGMYRVGHNCEALKESKALDKLRKEGLDMLGWRETLKVFERVLGEGYAA